MRGIREITSWFKLGTVLVQSCGRSPVCQAVVFPDCARHRWKFEGCVSVPKPLMPYLVGMHLPRVDFTLERLKPRLQSAMHPAAYGAEMPFEFTEVSGFRSRSPLPLNTHIIVGNFRTLKCRRSKAYRNFLGLLNSLYFVPQVEVCEFSWTFPLCI